MHAKVGTSERGISLERTKNRAISTFSTPKSLQTREGTPYWSTAARKCSVTVDARLLLEQRR